MIFFGKKPNRETYLSHSFRILDPIDRAHIILVAERAKPLAHCGFSDLEDVREYLCEQLNIFIINMRGRREYFQGDRELVFPNRVATVCASKKIRDLYLKYPDANDWKKAYDAEGRMLGYPSCCREEYSSPSYPKKFSELILRMIPSKLFYFKIECIRELLDGKEIPEEFYYLMPSQTPCSISCEKSKKLLSKWRKILLQFDPKAAEELVKFNNGCFQRYKEIASYLKKKGVKSEEFRKGYVYRA